VGYGAIAFSVGERGIDASGLPNTESSSGSLTPADRTALLGLARRMIERYLENGTLPLARGLSAAAKREQGVFVTLRKGGQLRGCVGQLAPDGSITRLVARMALGAAFQDPRFQKVTAGEMKNIEIEISLLTPASEVRGAGDVRVGRDGVVLQKDGKSALFLPGVATEYGWDRFELLEHLCAKAELPGGCWRSGAKLSTFQAEVFAEDRR
jgi:AmmeMemoRadiSam system protein A